MENFSSYGLTESTCSGTSVYILLPRRNFTQHWRLPDSKCANRSDSLKYLIRDASFVQEHGYSLARTATWDRTEYHNMVQEVSDSEDGDEEDEEDEDEDVGLGWFNGEESEDSDEEDDEDEEEEDELASDNSAN